MKLLVGQPRALNYGNWVTRVVIEFSMDEGTPGKSLAWKSFQTPGLSARRPWSPPLSLVIIQNHKVIKSRRVLNIIYMHFRAVNFQIWSRLSTPHESQVIPRFSSTAWRDLICALKSYDEPLMDLSTVKLSPGKWCEMTENKLSRANLVSRNHAAITCDKYSKHYATAMKTTSFIGTFGRHVRCWRR